MTTETPKSTPQRSKRASGAAKARSGPLAPFLNDAAFMFPERVVSPTSWLGHTPFGAWIVDALRPSTLVELGVHTGNSYAAFCQAAEAAGLDARFYGVDHWKGDPHAGEYGPDVLRELRAWHDPRYGGFSHLVKADFDEAAANFGEGEIELLHIDGLHTYEAVRHDFETWSPKLAEGGVVLFHDITVRHGDFGVWKLWAELEEAHPGASFAFTHCNGLGVLAPKGAPSGKGLAALFKLKPDEAAAVRRLFARLGDAVMRAGEQNEDRALIAALKEVQEQSRKTNQTLKAVTVERDGLLEAVAQHRAVLDETRRERDSAQEHVSSLTAQVSEARRKHEEASQQLKAAEDQHEREEQAWRRTDRARAREIAHLEAQRDQAMAQAEAIRTSTLWRLTSPIRSVAARMAPQRGGASAATPEDHQIDGETLEEVRGLLKDLPLFDAAYYREAGRLGRQARAAPLRHYLEHGEADGRRPHPLFDPTYYSQRYTDLPSEPGAALRHFLTHGVDEGRTPCAALDPLPIHAEKAGRTPREYMAELARSKAATAAKLEAFYTDTAVSNRGEVDDRAVRCAIVVHVFYPDIWAEIAERLRGLTQIFDLYVTVPDDRDDEVREAVLQDFPHASITALPNQGRDIRPFLALLNTGVFYRYSYVCKLHTKRSPHRKDGESWRRALYGELIGSSQRVADILRRFDLDPQTGLIAPHGHVASADSYIGANQFRIDALRRRIGDDIGAPLPPFPAGSMFWFRPAALKPLERMQIEAEEFEPEEGQLDGTLAHALERVFPIAARVAGYSMVSTGDVAATREAHNPVVSVAFACSEADPSSAFGDVFTARELSEALTQRYGWRCRLVGRGAWPSASDADIVVAMLDDVDPGAFVRADGSRPLTVGWARNWFDRWAARAERAPYDLYLASGEVGADILRRATDRPVSVLKIAGNPSVFHRGPGGGEETLDFVFTGNRWGSPRDVEPALAALAEHASGAIHGGGWRDVDALSTLAAGPRPYAEMPAVYASAKLCIDDANEATRRFGSVNSRVFDAALSGCLPITNGRLGAEATFGDLLPVFDDADGLVDEAQIWLGDDEARKARAAALRAEVASHHSYEVRAAEFLDRAAPLLQPLHIAIKTPVPSAEVAHEWGDWHFANQLGAAFERLGAQVRIDLAPQAEHYDGESVTLVLRGLERWRPDSRTLSLMWMISHPDKVADAELEAYDHVFVASASHAVDLDERISTPVSTLLQCTDRRFAEAANDVAPHGVTSDDVLFVGNSRNEFRIAVNAAIAADLPLKVFGAGWKPFIASPPLAGEHIENAKLAAAYANAGLVLNDHWADMAARGFLSNRLFDAAASGACIVSDPVKGLDDVFGDMIETFQSADELKQIAQRLLADPDERARRGAALRDRVLSGHTFDHRAYEIARTALRLVRRRRFAAEVEAQTEGSAAPGLDQAARL